MAGVEPEARTYPMENLENESSQVKIHGMLLGAPGAGKSSLVNSLTRLCSDYYPKRKYPYIPTARKQLMGGHTMMRERVELTDTLTVVDNRGWHDWGEKSALKELTAQIHGTSSFNKDVTWTEDTSNTNKARQVPRVIADKIDCIAIVINGNGGIGAIENLDKLIDTCRNNTRRAPSFVITHRDKMSPEDIENITSTLEDEYDVDPEQVFVIENVTKRTGILDSESKSSLQSFVEAWVGDGEIGAALHAAKEEELKREEELEIIDKIKEIDMGKLNLESERQAVAVIQLDTETQRQKKVAEISVLERKSQYDNKEDLHEINKDHILTINQVKLEHEKLFHEQDTKCLKEYWAKKE